MNVTCPECSYVHRDIDRDLIGKLVSCAECGAKFEIGPPLPQPPPVPAPAPSPHPMPTQVWRRRKSSPKASPRAVAIAFTCCLASLAWYTHQFLAYPPSDRSSSGSPRCIVSNSSWDGSVSQVKSYVRKIVSDPDPEFVEWSPVAKRPDGGFMVRTRIRGRNAFGGYVISDVWVWLDSAGKVQRHTIK